MLNKKYAELFVTSIKQTLKTRVCYKIMPKHVISNFFKKLKIIPKNMIMYPYYFSYESKTPGHI